MCECGFRLNLARPGHCPGPLFLLEYGLLVTRSLVTNRLRAVLLSAGLSSEFSSHIFQFGPGSHFRSRGGVQDDLIQVMGWRKTADYKQYIITTPHLITSAAKSLVE